ncbi:MAG: hypothetical protein LH472_11905 [Pyrinomonadaceae bacterium]|nr:hypothetical protein [Pyrinomonadaceae bacterium]
MKKFFYPAIIAVLLAGCSSVSTPSTIESGAANKINIANAPINTATNRTADLPTKQANLNIGNSANANQPIIQDSSISQKNLEIMKSKRGGGDQNAAPIPATNATPNPAPDNSEISSTMNEKGVPIETRAFKNNPILLKTERTFADINNPVTKVYLKNGKVLIVPKGAIADPVTAKGDDFLRAVGVKP